MTAPRVTLLSPVPLDSPRGNAVTVARIAAGLRERGVDLGVWDIDTPGLGERVLAQPPALIHAFHAYRTGRLALSLARAAGAPLVVTLTGTDVSHDLHDRSRRAAVIEVLGGAAAVVAFHGSIAAEVEAAVPSVAGRVRVVPQSVRFPAGPDGQVGTPMIEGDPCILFPAGIRPVKRSLLPLEPLERVHRERPGSGSGMRAPSSNRPNCAGSSRDWSAVPGRATWGRCRTPPCPRCSTPPTSC
jgi:hypothetical protein